MAKTIIIEGKGPDGSKRFAGISDEVRFVEGRVASSKFEAMLTPFRDLAEAKAGLLDAGTSLQGGGK